MADMQAFDDAVKNSGLGGKVQVVESRMLSLLVKHGATGHVCQVGSKTAKPANAYRTGCIKALGGEFVGIDIFPGENVDVVADLCRPEFPAENPGLIGHFGAVISSAMLEHVEQPFDAARNIAALLRPGGVLYCAVPWVWGYHAVPDDYWRFSVAGVKKLFPGLEWIEWIYAGTGGSGFGFKMAPGTEKRAFMVPVTGGLAGLLSDHGLPNLNIIGVGRRPA